MLAQDLAFRNQCQEVIDRSLSVINLHGLDAQTEQLIERSSTAHNPNWKHEDCFATLIAEQLLDWIKQSFGKLQPGERDWLPTEILESLFDKFKQMERQPIKGEFTCLIAALPTLCMQPIESRGEKRVTLYFHLLAMWASEYCVYNANYVCSSISSTGAATANGLCRLAKKSPHKAA